MFGWFQPTCPVPDEEKSWTEQRMRWLAGHFGLDRLRQATVILPTPEFFPEPYAATEADGRVLFRRVCRYLNVDPEPLQLEFYTEKAPLPGLGDYFHEGTAGLYLESGWARQIRLERSTLADPLVLVATAAHEVAHLLLGSDSTVERDADHERLTDLATIYTGFGVFTANSRIRSQAGHDGLAESWSIRRLGYLNQPTVGYALALFAWIRGEENPAWAGHLCADVKAPFRSGLRFLRKTGAALFDPEKGAFPMSSDDELPPGFEKTARR
jgi:hypothetical protein